MLNPLENLIFPFHGAFLHGTILWLNNKPRTLCRLPHVGNRHHPLSRGNLQPSARRQREATVERAHAALGEPEGAAHLGVNAMLKSRGGVNADRLHAERPADSVDGVTADIQQTASAEVGPQSRGCGRRGVAAAETYASGAGDVFDVSPYDYIFMQNAIDGNPVGIFLNAPGMTAYPNATWGAELKVQTTDRTYLRGGVYNGDIEHTHELHDHGLDWSMNGPAFVIGEAVYQTNQLKGDTGLPGNYKFGIWYDGHSYQDFGSKVLGPMVPGIIPQFKQGNYGFYGLFDQVVVRFSSPSEEILRGIGVTACVQAAPDQERSQMPLFFEAAILARGIFSQRPRDVAGFGIIYGEFSSDLRSAERLAQQLNPKVGVQDQETVLEWNYTFRFRNGAFFIEPDMQYIIRPGGTGNIPNALVVGAQVGINF
jgi:Carbohydrate-selective porin, OprB family